MAYEKHSMFGYKGYPEPSINFAYYYDENISYNLMRAPFVWNRKYAAWITYLISLTELIIS